MRPGAVKTCLVWAGRWAWLCPYAMLGLAAAILLLLGFSVWTSLLVAILLVCPAVLIWGAIQVRRRKSKERERGS
ncbi:MAG: hypothetical protein HY203_04705 [Nitrospirae bacterium]|nr:hypothetical protein [Nitrospirota bacterium]